MKLTNERAAENLKRDIFECPNCGKEIHPHMNFEYGDLEYVLDVSCGFCGLRWREFYCIQRVEILDEE